MNAYQKESILELLSASLGEIVACSAGNLFLSFWNGKEEGRREAENERGCVFWPFGCGKGIQG